MSQENAEIVRAAFEAWNRGDWDAVLQDASPDFVLDNSRDLGEWRGVHDTPDQVKRVWQRLTEAWESVRFEINELIPAGDRILSRQTATFCGRGGIRVEYGQTGSGPSATAR